MRRTNRKLRIGAPALVLAVGAWSGACRPKQAQEEPAPELEPAEPSSDGPVEFVYPGAPGSFVQLAEDVAPGIVSIRSTRKVLGGPADDIAGVEDDLALGTGFFIDTAGYILTNDHVIASSPEIRVRMHDGTEHAAIVAGRDPKLDIALLKIDESPRNIKALPLGDSERTRVGEWVMAVGDPFGMGASVSAGIVSHKGGAPIGPTGEFHRAYLQTDANIHSGNSGGPLVDLKGDVIGINVAVSSRGAKVGYAVPIDQAKRILPQLKIDGRVSRAWLGARVLPVTAGLARQLELERPTGAFVTEVIKNGPAARAGIQKNDVILKYDKRPVDEKSLAWIAATTGIGRRIEVVIWRDGGERHLEFTSEALKQ